MISPARQANAGTEGPPGSPWQYDPSTNRHFDPGHNHWHSGQPPAGRVGTASTAGSLASSVRISPLANPGDATQIGSTGTAGPPGKPYEYDSVTNRHFDPGHNHWHPGLPPAGKVDTNTSIAVPNSSSATDGPPGKDWEYDPKTNRHFDPGHKHWHTGQPPNNVGTAAPGQVVPLVATSKSATGTKEDPLSLEQARRAIGLSPIVEASGGRGWKGPIGKPWEFNSNANLHYNPDHGHWHSGPPPIKPALGITTQ